DPSVHGYLTVYATGNSPIKMVKEMVVTEATPPLPTKSQYQHISYEKGTPDGNMYNIDAITGATLTVEGPGVVASVPISVGTLEGAKDACLYKGKYTDTRNGVTTERMYEGVRVADILAGTIHDKVKPVDENVTVLFKNRLRQTVATMKLSDIKKAKTPVILAYGTAMPDETNIRPFVYAMANGLDEKLGNGDGCLKVVYDQAAFPNAATSKIFSSVAYIYVEESQPAPGFKHNTVPYDGGENKQYLTTFGGKALGREVNLTTEEIENLVQYDASGNISSSGMGFRKEYGLANTTFWYVNEYEGVKLWDLLKSIGLKDSYKDDDKTKVAFTSWDNYKTAEVFSTKELANPDSFYLYEKAINDLGTSRPTASALIPPTGSQTTTVDAFGYPVQKGYPVLLAYGVNGYPYVKNSGLPGYKSGLGNDGGPMRVVFGKRDYFHNNGSNQLQRVQEIFVGDKVRYSTHQYNDTTNGAYQKIAKDANAALEVEVNLQGGGKQSKTFTVGELEALLYGRDEKGNELSKATIDQRQEKGYYYYKNAKNNAKIQDVFEGVNLWYLLSEAVGMQGQIGTVTFTDANGKTTFLPSLDPLKETGYNSVNGTGDLGAMIAFAKNGYPLVANKGDVGYVTDDPNGIKGVDGKVKPIKNSDGPLLFIMPQSKAEKEAGTLPEVATVNNLKKISINLEADQYAHTQGAYADYKDQKVNFTGAVKTTPMAISVEEIEKKQKYMVTDTYTISSSAIEGETLRYRGVELSKFLNSAEVGMSSLAETITVKNTSGDSVQIPILELVNGVGGKKIILAYGSNGDLTTSAGVGLPLVPSTTSAGYQPTYKNSGGPLKLIIQSTDGTFSSSKCIENVSEIEVTASKVTGWTHEYGVYASYKDLPALRVSGSDIKTPKTFTVGEIEGLTNLMKQDTYKIGAADADIQGIKLWEFIRDEVGLKEGVTVPSALDFYSPDGYKVSMTGEISRVMSGDVNGKPLLIAYGMNGLPLVAGNDSTDRKPGFDETKGNAFGPLRLVVNDNSGWCAKWLSSIVVGTGSAEKPEADGFRISGDGIESGGKNFTKEGLQSLGEESRDYTYMSGKERVTDQVKGVSLDRVISGAGIDMAYGYTVNLKTTDGFNGNYKYDGTNKIPTYEHITLGAIKNQNYFVAYEVSGAAISDKDKNNVEANFRIYRNYAATVSGTAIDGSTNWLNCAKNIEGIEIVDPIANQVIFTISAKDFQSPSTYNLSKAYTKKELLAMKATTKSYKYKNQEVSAKGVMLSQLVKDLGIENPNTTITITTTDNYQDTTHGSNLKEIPVGELASKDYLVAYEVDGKTIEDTHKTEAKNTAYVQIYRTMDAGDSGKSANRIKNVNGMKLNPAYNWQTYLKEPNKPAVNEIRNMVAAADGGIWMGTKNGIHYATSQGAITKSYTTANGLPVNWVYDVVPDSKGGLWATQGYDYGNLDNNKGIVYISNTGEITNHTTENTDRKLPHNFVQALELDSSGNLWIGSFGGLTKFNPATNTWKTYTKADGLPALSVNVLTKDSKGGLWIGCYPEYTDITTGPFSGGYAYMDPKGVLTKFDADTKGEGLNSGYLADYWVTSIAVGKNDEAWIVRSGAYPYLDNVGGRVDYVSPDKQTVKKYKGKELIPDIEKLKIVTEPATANYYPEIRTVAVDGKGGIWFGTDGIGTYYCSQGKKGDISVIDRFSNSTFDWPLPLIDNVYALTILPNGGVYTGGTGGAAWNVFENLNVENESGGGGKDPEKPEIPSQVDLLIDGDDVEAKVGLTMAEIKEMPSITETYDSLNNFGTRGSSTFTGVPLSEVLKKANLKSSAKSVRMIAK
ncbi:MAG: two-component regulator propeller domain-containing protein, partial [Anaerovorax sp.]